MVLPSGREVRRRDPPPPMMAMEEGVTPDSVQTRAALLTFWEGLESMNEDRGPGRPCSWENEICSQCTLAWRWPKESRDPGLREPSDGGSPSFGTCGGSD